MEIEIACELPEEIDPKDIIANLPQRKTKVVEAKCINHLTHLKAFTDCNTVDEVKLWMHEFETVSQTSYSITVTKTVSGRYVAFKQYLHCQHKTKSRNLYDSSKHNNITRNTNCPSTLKITLHAEKKRYQTKDKARNELFKVMRCEIDLILTHNHHIGSATALSFRKVSNEVRENLINLYCNGHSPATALQTIKMDIYMNVNNYEQILADRMHCPDYNYCYNVYIHEFKEKYGSLDFDLSGKQFLKRKLEEYNEKMKDNCTEYENDVELIKSTKERAQVILEEFSIICARHIEKSPNDVGPALEKMLENMRKIRSVSTFTSACSSFASDYRRRNRRSRILVQPTAVSRRKTALSGQNSNVGGRPRKNKIKARVTRKRTVHKLSEVIASNHP